MNRSPAARTAALAAAAVLLAAGPSGAVTLDACIRAALDHNPGLEAAEARVAAARTAIRQAESALYPLVSASSTYGRTDNPPQAFMMILNQRRFDMQTDFNNPGDTENLNLQLSARYRVLDGGQRGLARRMAGAGAEASAHALDAARNDLLYQVARGYYGVLQAAEFVNVRDASIRSLEENLRAARERLAAGSAVKTDVLNLEVELARAREDRIRAGNAVRLGLSALNTAIGIDAVSETNMPAADSRTPLPPPAEDASAVTNRPEYQAAAAAVRIRQLAWRKAVREYYPTLNAFGSADWNSDVSSSFEDSYMVGLMAEVDVFDGFRRRSAAAEARAQFAAARAEWRQAESNLKFDLHAAHLNAGEAFERLEVARKSVESAEEALRITRERYQGGAADITELLTAELGLTGVRTRSVAAQYDYLTALQNLARARGELARIGQD